jgi:hypothetical protein
MRVVNIHNQSANIRGIIHVLFHIDTNNTNILHAKLQGANHVKKAIRIVFLFLFSHLSLFLIFLYIRYIARKNNINQLIICM